MATPGEPLYREVQPYRELPPFTLLVAAGTLFGWALVVWTGLLGRSIGEMQLSRPLALAIGLPLAILLPLAYTRLTMVTEVHADRLVVKNGLSSRVVVPYANIMAVTLRTDDIRGDYSQRHIGEVSNTRTAYTVGSSKGVQVEMGDTRLILVGSKEPEALSAALSAAWAAATAPAPPLPVAPEQPTPRSRPTSRF